VSLGRGVAGLFLVPFGVVLGVFLFQGLEKSLRLSGTLVVHLL
jgi:hypothetical protein